MSILVEEQEKAGCFAIIVKPLHYFYKCSVALPRSAVGWSVYVIVVFHDPTHLLFIYFLYFHQVIYSLSFYQLTKFESPSCDSF